MALNKNLTGADRERQNLKNKAWLQYALACGVGVMCGCGRFTRRPQGICRKCERKDVLQNA